MFDDPEALTEIASRAFARAKDAAIRENDRLGIPSYGSKDGKIVVRQPPRQREQRPMTDDEFEEARRRGRALLRRLLKDPKRPPYRAKHADDPWLNAMLDDVHKRMSAMIEARGDGEFTLEEDLRYMRLVRELAEISTAMHDTKP